jgi:hypothetical protein
MLVQNQGVQESEQGYLLTPEPLDSLDSLVPLYGTVYPLGESLVLPPVAQQPIGDRGAASLPRDQLPNFVTRKP